LRQFCLPASWKAQPSLTQQDMTVQNNTMWTEEPCSVLLGDWF